MEERFALLIDADNVSAKYIKPILDELSKYGNVTYKRIYGDWTRPNSAGWKEELLQKLNREPTYQEIADALSMDVADVILAFEANQFVYSLDETIYENDGSPILLEDKVSNRKEEDVVMKVSLQNEIAHLEQREQLLLHYRYDLGMKQEEIAKKLQISQVQVSRLEKKILLKLKERLMVT